MDFEHSKATELHNIPVRKTDSPDAAQSKKGVPLFVMVLVFFVPVYAINLNSNAVLREVEVNRIRMEIALLLKYQARCLKGLAYLALWHSLPVVVYLATARAKASGMFSIAVDHKSATAIGAGYLDRVHQGLVCAVLGAARWIMVIPPLALKSLSANDARVRDSVRASLCLALHRTVNRVSVMPLRFSIKWIAAILANPIGFNPAFFAVTETRTIELACRVAESSPAESANSRVKPWHDMHLLSQAAVSVEAIGKRTTEKVRLSSGSRDHSIPRSLYHRWAMEST